jgi:agmatine deiminase
VAKNKNQKKPKKPSQTPAALGYRMPAEWEPHEATWIAWPHNRTDWPGKFEPIPWIYAEIVRHLSRAEHVNILVNDEAAETKARQVLIRSHVLPEKAAAPGKMAGNVRFFRTPTNRGWTRDFAPIFIRRDSRKGEHSPVAATKWQFNGWAKYDDWKLDAAAGTEIASHMRIPVWQPEMRVDGEMRHMVLEGGSIDVNGRGTLITTEECLLGDVQQRNPGLSREHLEEMFAEYLGIEKVVWLERGIAGDDTHGHVDDITRFVGSRTVVTAYEPDPDDPNHEPLSENFRWLKKSSDQSGKSLKVVKLPMPKPVLFEGQRLPASYANFYIANKLVLVPVFGDPNDRVALDTLAELFPEREVVGIYSRDFVLGLGAMHCITQQQPKG